MSLSFVDIEGSRIRIRPTVDERSYLVDMKISHRSIEPRIYNAALDFRFHPGKVLLDICSRENGERLGGFSIHGISDDQRSCELGYWILPEHLGQGYIQEATETLLNYMALSLKLERVSLVADVRNQRSIAVAERLGFHVEGSLRGKDLITNEPVTKLIYARYLTH